MSRSYELTITSRGLPARDVKRVARRYGWQILNAEHENETVQSTYQGNLTNDQDEEEAHGAIYAALKALNPQARIRTSFAYLDSPPPTNEYGDDFDDLDGLEEIL